MLSLTKSPWSKKKNRINNKIDAYHHTHSNIDYPYIVGAKIHANFAFLNFFSRRTKNDSSDNVDANLQST